MIRMKTCPTEAHAKPKQLKTLASGAPAACLRTTNASCLRCASICHPTLDLKGGPNPKDQNISVCSQTLRFPSILQQ